MSLKDKIAELEKTIADAKVELQSLIKESKTISKEEKLALLREERALLNKDRYTISNGLSVHKLRLAGNRVSISHIRYVLMDAQDQTSVLLPIPSYLRNFHEFTPNGGATHISITTPDNEEFLVSSYCHVVDNFDYKLGVKIALEGFSQEMADKLLKKNSN